MISSPDRSSSRRVGCEKNGDDVQNICTVTRAAYHSLESVPKWEEIDMQLQCPRTDCGFFQLGKFERENDDTSVELLAESKEKGEVERHILESLGCREFYSADATRAVSH